MVNVYPYLEMIRDKIIKLDLFKSVKVGLERGADKAVNCPFVRIISESEDYKGIVTSAVIQIVIVFDTKNDVELLYKEFYAALFEIKNKLFELPLKIELIDAYFDEDRLANLKAGVLRVRLADLVEYK
jgi:hypothetical protein